MYVQVPCLVHQGLQCTVVIMICLLYLQEVDLCGLATEALRGAVAVNSKVEHMFCLFADFGCVYTCMCELGQC